MKHGYVQCFLAAVLLAVIAVPVVDSGARAADRTVVKAPAVMADAWPTPWPKKPAMSAAPTVMADAWPTPWPKKPGFVLS